ncbi:MAG: hypothetical protein IPL43_02140 [Micropruina sp.]|nr:hypothetical protein [Micropruina sp.]
MNTASPSPFDSFNARALSPAAVARTFVEPKPQYNLLVKRAHSLLVGPRGGGKTTLLKMLTPEGIEHWRDAPEAVLGMDYSGVFVPTDIAWDRQLKALGGAGLPTRFVDALVVAIFTTHTLKAFVTCLRYRVAGLSTASRAFRRLSMTRAQEAEVARAMSRVLDLELPLASLSGLIAALGDRSRELIRFASAESLMSEDGRAERFAACPGLFQDIVTSTVSLIDILEAFKPELVGER